MNKHSENTDIEVVAIDLTKKSFQLHGVDRHGKAIWRRRLKREKWLKVLLQHIEPGCEIGMEACTGAHHWARELQARGYTVRLIAPQFALRTNRFQRRRHECTWRLGFAPSSCGSFAA